MYLFLLGSNFAKGSKNNPWFIGLKILLRTWEKVREEIIEDL